MERVSCELTRSCNTSVLCVGEIINVNFNIDPNQFVAPIDVNEPPRNKVTVVESAGQLFRAEPIRMDTGMRGFWAIAQGSEHLLTIQSDGSAIYSQGSDGHMLTGTCEVTT